MTGTAIVAGVGPTIGEAVARRLHERGYKIGLFARSSGFIDDLAADLGDGALAVPTDVTEAEAVRDGVETVREAHGPIEVLVLNATGGAGRPVDRASADRLRSVFDVRVAGSLACVQAAREDLRETRGTVIFSGTTFAEGGVSSQVEWGAVGPAAQGLAASLSSALDRVQVTYVRIGSQVLPAEQAGDGTIPATDVAALYLDLIDRERVETAVCEVSARE